MADRSPFDKIHKMANSLVRDQEPIQVPFVNYTQLDGGIVLAIIPGPCPPGYESKLRNLIDKDIGFKCTVRESDAALILATFVIESAGDNNCEFVLDDENADDPLNFDAVKSGFERLIDETTASIKLH